MNRKMDGTQTGGQRDLLRNERKTGSQSWEGMTQNKTQNDQNDGTTLLLGQMYAWFSWQEKIQKLYDRKLHGDFDTNSHIQKKKEFRNPRCVTRFLLLAVLFPSVIQ